MAIKGKKKPKSRPRSARRRPTPSGRAPVAAVKAPPFHRTMGGQLTLILLALAIIGFVMWRLAENRSEDQATEARQTELRGFTTEASDVVATVQEPVREMMGAAFNTANPEAIDALEEDAAGWIEALELAGAKAQALAGPEDLAPVVQVLQQSFMLYVSAAKTYALVPGEDAEKRQQELIQRSTEQRDLAGRLMTAALGMLDDARDEAEMDPAGIQAPATMTPILPSPASSPTQPGGGGGGNDGGGGNSRGSGGGEGSNDG